MNTISPAWYKFLQLQTGKIFNSEWKQGTHILVHIQTLRVHQDSNYTRGIKHIDKWPVLCITDYHTVCPGTHLYNVLSTVTSGSLVSPFWTMAVFQVSHGFAWWCIFHPGCTAAKKEKNLEILWYQFYGDKRAFIRSLLPGRSHHNQQALRKPRVDIGHEP